jgi:signal transduction histidine kinase
LPEETEVVEEMVAEGWRDTLAARYPSEFLERLRQNEVAYFSAGDRQGAGRMFHLSGKDYVVIVTAVDQVGIAMLSNLRTILALSMVAAAALMTVLSRFLSGRILRPISAKILKANTITAGNLHERLRVFNRDDEIGQLALAFNGMLDRIDQAFNAQKLFVANASHEIRNPLTTIIGTADVTLQKARPQEEYEQALKSIQSAAERLNVLVNNLLQLTAVSTGTVEVKKSRLNLQEVIKGALEGYASLNPDHRIVVDALPEGLVIEGNRQLLQAGLMNVLDNACKFSQNQEVRVSLTRSADSAELFVIDRGVGIPPEDIPRITQPFFRSDNVRQIPGSGIGIPLALRIMELHGGRLSGSSEVNKGTRVSLIFPLLR